MKSERVHHYKVIIEKGDDGQFIARVPALPGCVTQAKTYEQLQLRLKEAVQLCLEVAKRDRTYRKKQAFFGQEPTFLAIEDLAVSV